MTEPLAYQHNGQPVEGARFYAIACDPRRHVAVQACAGAGKTWMLVSRILRALLEGAPPHEVLAITFTKKAAAEVRQRLHQWLAEFANAAPAQLIHELIERGVDPQAAPQQAPLLRDLRQKLLAAGRPVQIRTFHSWFAALLRGAPVAVLQELGLPVNYQLLEDDSQAVRLVWRPFHGAVAASPAARADFEASVAAYGRSQTQQALATALAKRVEFALADGQGVVQDSVKAFGDQFPEFRELSEPTQLLADNNPARALLAQAALALGRAFAPSFSAQGAALAQALQDCHLQGAIDSLLTQKGEPRKFSDKLEGLPQVRAAQALALRIAAACCQHEAWLHHRRMTRLTRLLIAEFGALKREHGWVDMNDVERAAMVMLSDPVLSGWAQERLDARLRHVLIDEFQDTNPLQWQALSAWLSGYSGAGSGAPSVFLVGDPKQSIYRFRRAEPQVFRAAQAFVVDGLGGDLLSCDHTRRNAPELIAVINAVIGAAQAAGEFEGFRDHTTASQDRGSVLCLPQIERPRADPAQASGALAWRDSLTAPREQPEEKLIAQECRQAAAWIAGQLADGVRARDIMVLARKRNRLAVLEGALRALQIPARQPEQTELSQAPEVQDLVALLDVLVSPDHDLSLARALKSPLFGLADDALVAIALRARAARQAGQPRSWFELLQGDVELAAPLRGIGATLLGWKARVDALPPHDALAVIFREGDVLARFAAAAPLPRRTVTLANLRALLGAALQVQGGRYLTPYGLVRALKTEGIRGPALDAADAVNLLTVHGAKGLEAAVVLILDTDSPPARAGSMGVVVDWPGQQTVPRRFGFMASETRPAACSAEAVAVERAARQREELNALYVAMTRAKSRLVLSSVQPHQAAPASWWQRLRPWSVPIEAVAARAPLAAAADLPFSMAVLPPGPPLPALPALPLNGSAPRPVPDSADSRFGQAVHRLLERWPVAAQAVGPEQLLRVAREFGLAPAMAQDAASMAQRIVRGEGGWAWDPAAIDWHSNEVELVHDGELLRLDRLVRRTGTGHWWVLDYKSVARPEDDPDLLAQMKRYRAAVQAVYPECQVQAAFLTGQGRMVVLP